MKKIIKIAGLLLNTIAMSACGSEPAIKWFGDFSYNGIFLTEYATKNIVVDEAKDLVEITPANPSNRMVKSSNKADNGCVEAVLTKYASVVATVKYYVSEEEQQQVRKDIFQGTDFKSLLDTNHYEPFGQMSVKYLFVDDTLLDDMEKQNEDFKNSNLHIISPFNDLYTYHTNEENKLILQIHHFAELPASSAGGIGSAFRQDCELIFDEEGKIMFWQSSLGLYTSTPTGTVREGFIFEVEFEWINK